MSTASSALLHLVLVLEPEEAQQILKEILHPQVLVALVDHLL